MTAVHLLARHPGVDLSQLTSRSYAGKPYSEVFPLLDLTGEFLSAPAVSAGLVGSDIVVDAKSGVSGAGRSIGLGTHFSEVNESLHAYAIEGHRHLPEIIQELDGAAVTFVPHLVPMTRGILATCYF